VDGNVARVLARLFELAEPQDSAAFRRRAWQLAAALVPQSGAGEWNQALMELGATLCTPREPRCADCPLVSRCGAARAGRAGELPRPRRRPEPIEVELHVALAERAGRVLVARRPESGRMAGLWELPVIEPAGLGRLHPARWPLTAGGAPLLVPGEELGRVAHSITRHRVCARVFRAACAPGAEVGPLRWAGARDREALGLTGLACKVLRAFAAGGAR
jgi:A/G-specific adenine glycosylase